MTKDELKMLCLEFDKSQEGGWPEHEFEGRALYDYFLSTINFPQEKINEELDAYTKEIENGQPK